MGSSIKLENVSKIYRIYDKPSERFRDILSSKKKYGTEKYALKNLSMDIKDGEILGIIGVNGSGKSTLLKIITGVLQPTTGIVEVNGKISALLELGAGFNPEYTGIENIYFNGMLMGFSREEMALKFNDIVSFADIGEYIYQPVRTYSSGMVVRLAYAIAVNIEPDILIIDEALAVGDSYFQLKSISKMQELFKKGKTVLLVSHDIGSIKSLCNKALYLNQGEVIAYGEAKTVVDMYEKNLRDTMSEVSEMSTVDIMNNPTRGIETLHSSNHHFIKDESFCKRVDSSREGSGTAQVVALQLLDKNETSITSVSFNQECILRIFVLFHEKCSICIGYHIRNDKNIIILGSNTSYEGHKELIGEKGDKIIADFKFRLPLIEGRYNIMTVLSESVHANLTSRFIDITKDGFYFDMQQAVPNRIWNALQLPNEVSVKKCV